MTKYMSGYQEGKGIQDVAEKLFQNPQVYKSSKGELTIVKRTETVDAMKPILSNFFFIVIMFMVFLTVILNQSLVQSVNILKANHCYVGYGRKNLRVGPA